jgi:predicted Fe-S protein YdhL (DUF1289 family)
MTWLAASGIICNVPMTQSLVPDDSSPCIKICRLSPTQSWCLGCGRSVEDIAKWRDYTSAQRIAAKVAATERLRQGKLANS